jgi:hypothetical protein
MLSHNHLSGLLLHETHHIESIHNIIPKQGLSQEAALRLVRVRSQF